MNHPGLSGGLGQVYLHHLKPPGLLTVHRVQTKPGEAAISFYAVENCRSPTLSSFKSGLFYSFKSYLCLMFIFLMLSMSYVKHYELPR